MKRSAKRKMEHTDLQEPQEQEPQEQCKWEADLTYFFVRDTANSPFVNHKGKDINFDWLADQWDEQSILGHLQFHKGRMKGDDPDIDTAQTSKHFDGHLALLEKIRITFTDCILNNLFPSMGLKSFKSSKRWV